MFEIFEIKPALDFIKRNLKIYSIIAIILIVFFGGIFGYDQFIKNKVTEEPDVHISFLVENSQGYSYTQSDTIKEIIILSLSQDNQITNEIKEKLEDNLIVRTSKSSFITVEISDYSKKTSRMLRKSIKADLINEKLDFFKNKKIYNITDELPENQTTIDSGSPLSAKKIVILLFIYALFTLLIGTFIGISKERKNSIISDFYSLKGKNKVYLDSYLEIEKQKIISGLVNNIGSNSIIVSQGNNDISKEFLVNDLGEEVRNLDKFSRVFILCKKDSTTKSWYDVQEKLAELFSENVTTIFY
ncbi:hypothetical protein JZO81_13010 [Enterococcus hulanensis]|uniref:hypothetical protein n=1 Tax=Enterococcus hulanensis TaxID=2559929 RepID=UPI001A9239D6|nr:hypothetical protein [Enterococcus hulanensis]MBO0411989.1 hypothetical protein [Enterococcus hulanensis]